MYMYLTWLELKIQNQDETIYCQPVEPGAHSQTKIYRYVFFFVMLMMCFVRLITEVVESKHSASHFNTCCTMSSIIKTNAWVLR